MSCFTIQEGLPPYGPAALPFPESGQSAFREGLVIRFSGTTGDSWIGNFQRGFPDGFDFVVDHPDGRHVIIIAGGTGYIVDPGLRRQTHLFGGGVDFAQDVQGLGLVVFSDGVSFGAIDAGGTRWRSEQVSWDGIRNIVVDDATLRAEAWSPIPDRWHPFELNLLTGATSGAIYGLQMAHSARANASKPQ